MRNSEEMAKLYLQSKGADISNNSREYRPKHLFDAYQEGYEDGSYWTPELISKIQGLLTCIRKLSDEQGSYQTSWISDYTAQARELLRKIEES